MTARELLAGVFGTAAGFLLASVTALAANIALARGLGATGYGTVALMLTWATIGAQAAQLGLMRASTRVVSVETRARDPGALKSFLGAAFLAVALASAVTGLGVWAGLRALGAEAGRPAMAAATGLMIWPLAVMRVGAGVMLGRGRGFAGAFFQTGLAHLALLVAGGWLMAAAGPGGLGRGVPAVVAGLYAAAIVAVAVTAWRLGDVWRAARGPVQLRAWGALALPLMVVGLIQVLNRQIGTVIVGHLSGADAVAAYYPALRIADFATFGTIAVNAAVSARLAAASAAGDTPLLQEILRRAARLTFAVTLGLVPALFLARHAVLGAFGGVAASGAPALSVLLAGQLFVATAGSAGVLMAMAGQERFAAVAAAAVLAVNVALHVWLVPRFGITGAALAAGASTLLWTVALVVRAWLVMGVDVTIFAPVRKRNRLRR